MKLLLHVCCATCAAYVIESLRDQYDLTAYYYNPNIYPALEYDRRFVEVQHYCRRISVPLIEEKPDVDRWFTLTAGHANDPERGERCTICYLMRLEKTARYARDNNYDIFGTDLSISPHKDARRLNAIGRTLEEQYGVSYLVADFKKQNGFQRAMEISRHAGFYRQSYCGCRYSIRTIG